MYGYQLRAEFESATGSLWPLNVGQVYTTLTRLERDGLVTPQGQDEEGRSSYAITHAGRAELEEWFGAPVTLADRPRDELAIKLALAVTVPGVDVRAVVQRQRSSTMSHLQSLTRLRREAGDDLSWALAVDSMRFQAEAEIRWLDHCETQLARRSTPDPAAPTSAARPSRKEVRR